MSNLLFPKYFETNSFFGNIYAYEWNDDLSIIRLEIQVLEITDWGQ